MSDSIGEDLRLLKRKIAPPVVDKRRKADQRYAMKSTDGRKRRRGVAARDEQINFKVPEGTKARIQAVAERLETSMIDVFERALELIEIEVGLREKP